MATTHKITATRRGNVNGMDFDEEYEITFEYRKGAPEQGPSYASGGQPADPDEIEFVSITPGAGDQGGFSDIAQRWLEDEARDWLETDGFDKAMSIVIADQDAAREYAADLRADR